MERAFLAPLFSFISCWKPGAFTELPLFALLILSWLRDHFRDARMISCSKERASSRELFRVDAKAEGMQVVIGGWKPHRDPEGNLDCSKSPWFSVTLTEESAPWAFEGGRPYTKIASLELLATTVGITLFGPELLGEGHEDGVIELP